MRLDSGHGCIFAIIGTAFAFYVVAMVLNWLADVLRCSSC